ncbi:unnamed protein product [Paramecium sonneborni]|uniref:Uncharacterized protein n=1 Tax=Paramecium sonneborni TaxID=65129 RepID=A0A8S1R391_9CILI|nr:unnamed protein product [Paramecium sonneborni]
MNHRYIFLLQIIQNIWWIIEMLLIQKSSNYTYYFLCSLCITTRLLASIIYLKQHQKHDRFILITTLANNVCYTEANINFESKNLYLNHINTLIILLNYMEAQILIKNQPFDLLTKFTFPTYILMRLISLIFIQFDIQLCEATSLMLLFLCVYFSNYNTSVNSTQTNPKLDHYQQNCSASLHQSQVKLEKHLTLNSNKLNHGPDKNSQPRNSFQINIKDSYREESAPIPTFHSKLKPGYKSQYSHLVVDRNDSQLQNFYQNLVNVLPEGVLMLNKFQQIQFISTKCEKLLECDGKEKVIEYIKKCLSNCDLPEDVQSMTRTKNKLTQRVLEEIIRIYKQNFQELDIFDVLLNPNKYIQALFSGQNGQLEQDRSSSGSVYFSDPSTLQEHTFCFEGSIEKEKNDQSKKLKFILVQTQMTLTQQEAISQNGQTNSKRQGFNDMPQPILLILIKNITHKNKVKELKEERLINNSLLKSFSHELRTPLNSCQYMLNLIKEVSKDDIIQMYLNTASSSIKLLIYQINDILDFAAMQSKSFSYHTTTFCLKDLIQEIHDLYDQQTNFKNIKLDILYDQSLYNQFFINDKQRIMQVLVNLLNNSCKFTKPYGEVSLIFKQMKGNLIEVTVRDDGIGIQSNKLELLRKAFCKPSSKISHEQSALGFGLKISGKIVKGLTYNKNYLDINSSHNNGTQVSFLFQNQEIINQEFLLSPQQSNITGRFEMSSPASSKFIHKLELSQSLTKGLQQKFETPQNESIILKEHLESPRLNQDQLSQVIIPTSCYHFKNTHVLHHKKQGSLQSFQININNCEDCSQILVVDDIPFNQIAFIQMLNHFKIKAESAFDGYQAIEMVKQKLIKHCKFYRLIFMDIEMPGQNGFQTSKIISQIPGVQSIIVMCSAYDTLDNYNFASQVGISEFLPKPVNKKDLDKILKKYLFKI